MQVLGNHPYFNLPSIYAFTRIHTYIYEKRTHILYEQVNTKVSISMGMLFTTENIATYIHKTNTQQCENPSSVWNSTPSERVEPQGTKPVCDIF